MPLLQTKRSAPTVPGANKVKIYVDTDDRRHKSIDEFGNIRGLAADGLKGRNILYNGGLTIQQRVATAATAIPSVSTTTRAGCVADRWAVTVGNATTPLWTQVDAVTPETGLLAKHYGRITQNTNAAKFIFSQFLAHEDISHLRGQKVRLSVKLKQFAGSNAVYRLGLLQLAAAGTVDVCPAFISAIGAASVEPTWGTNLLAITPDASPSGENGTISGAALSITSTANWVRSSAVFTIPTDCKNLCFVLYRDTLGAASDSVGIAELQMTAGTDIIDWVTPDRITEQLRCQRYFAKSFEDITVPVQNGGVIGCITGMAGKAGATALAGKIWVQFPVLMFASPTVTGFCPSAASAEVMRIDGATPIAHTATAQLHKSKSGVYFTSTGTANTAVGDTIAIHYTADCEFKT